MKFQEKKFYPKIMGISKSGFLEIINHFKNSITYFKSSEFKLFPEKP
jgi:hypothetical protein